MIIPVLLAVALAGAGVETETEQHYTDEDLWYLSHVIQAESGYCSTEMMQGVGSVVCLFGLCGRGWSACSNGYLWFYPADILRLLGLFGYRTGCGADAWL